MDLKDRACWKPDKETNAQKKVIEKSRECHNQKPQPTPDTKRKTNKKTFNAGKINKQKEKNAREALRPAPSLNEMIVILKGRKKKKKKNEKKEQVKT